MDSSQDRTIYLLHLSDLHFGREALLAHEDTVKMKWVADDVLTRFGQMEHVLVRLGVKFRFVIVSGDVTQEHTKPQFGEFLAFVRNMIERGVFPQEKRRLLVVPGNHDVFRKTHFEDIQRAGEETQYEDFWSHTSDFTIPYSPRQPNADFFTQIARKIDQGNLAITPDEHDPKLCNGIRQTIGQNTYGGRGPFACDLESGIMIYLFDSAEKTGSVDATLDETTLTAAAKWLQGAVNDLKGRKIEPVHLGEAVYNQFEKRQFWDIAMVEERQLALMDRVMAAADMERTYQPDHWLKLAVLHHHVGDLPSPGTSIKPFDRLVNSNIFKERLVRQRFAAILHGHRHYPAVLHDSGIIEVSEQDASPRGINIVAGGTIGGPSDPSNVGFMVIRVDRDSDLRAVRAWVKRINLNAASAAGAPPPLEEGWIPVWIRPDVKRREDSRKEKTALLQTRIVGIVDSRALRSDYLEMYVKRLEGGGSKKQPQPIEIAHLGEAMRRDVLVDLQKVVIEGVSALDMESLLNKVESVEKTVTFHRDGTYEAVTVYRNLESRQVNEDSVTVYVPIRIVGPRLPEGVRVSQVFSDDKPEGEEITGSSLIQFPTADGIKLCFLLKRTGDALPTYRLSYRGKFRLSREQVDNEDAPQQRENPATWNRHHNAFELVQECGSVKVVVSLPTEIVALDYKTQERPKIVVWPSGSGFDDWALEQADKMLSELGLDGKWRLEVETKPDVVTMTLAIDGAPRAGMHYGILWRQPMV